MKKRKLTDFMPLYSNSKTGSIVIDEPARDETPDMTPPPQLFYKSSYSNIGRKILADKTKSIDPTDFCRKCGEWLCNHHALNTGLCFDCEKSKEREEPAAPDLTTAEMDKLAGDERLVEPSVLPVLKSGDILVSRRGLQYRVHRVNKPKSGLYDEPRYRLERTVIGRQEWALDELNEQGMKLEE